MPQLTIRTSEELLARVRAAAHSCGLSKNEFVTAVLDTASNPDLIDGETVRLRERLALAGLPAEPASPPRPRPDARRVAAARVAAGSGTALSDLVGGDRD